VVVLGAALIRGGLLGPGFLREANRLTYWVGLPALLLQQLAAGLPPAGTAAPLMLTVGVGTLLVVGAGYGTGVWLRVPGASLGTFVQGAFRGNLAFVGLPIIFALPDTALAGGLTVRSAAVVVVAPAMVLYNLGGVIVLLLSQHRLSLAMAKPFLRQLLLTPPLVATVAGISCAALGWRLPSMLDRTLLTLGEMALPLGLLGIGGTLATLGTSTNWRIPGMAALIKTVLAPAIGWGLGRICGLESETQLIAMILMASPTAIVSYTMAVELKGDEAMASGIIVGSVVLSLPVLAVIVGVFGGCGQESGNYWSLAD
jgi:predicted permease